MRRIYAAVENCWQLEALLKAGLPALADKFAEHTAELQVGGCLTGANDTPELRAKLSGVNRTNTVVECVFALEKFLSTREKGSLLRHRKGWTLFKYNGTAVWGEQLSSGKLKLYTDVARRAGAAVARQEGGRAAQLERAFAHGAAEREAKLLAKRSGVRAAAEEVVRLSDPSLRVTTFLALKLLPVEALKEQLKLRAVVDKRREASGKPLIRSPPKNAEEGGRTWLVLKLQTLLKLEYKEGALPADPNDLPPGDLGCESRAPRKRRAREEGEPKQKKARKKAAEPEWDEDEEWPVEAILDKRLSTAADKKQYKWDVGTVLYLVAWEGWEEEYNSWEPYENIVDDTLISDYEERLREAEAEEAAEARTTASEAEPEPEPEPEPEAAEPEPVQVEVDSGTATPLTVAKILGHHVYGGARAGSLYNIYVRVQYSDGSRSNGMISAEPLAGTDALTAYLATGRGAKISKYAI